MKNIAARQPASAGNELLAYPMGPLKYSYTRQAARGVRL